MNTFRRLTIFTAMHIVLLLVCWQFNEQERNFSFSFVRKWNNEMRRGTHAKIETFLSTVFGSREPKRLNIFFCHVKFLRIWFWRFFPFVLKWQASVCFFSAPEKKMIRDRFRIKQRQLFRADPFQLVQTQRMIFSISLFCCHFCIPSICFFLGAVWMMHHFYKFNLIKMN